MLLRTVLLLISATIAAVFGFGNHGTGAYVSRILFAVFITFFIVSLIAGRSMRRKGKVKN